MWFKSIYLKTLREFRIAILGWGVGMGLLMYVVLAAVPSLIATPAARASVVLPWPPAGAGTRAASATRTPSQQNHFMRFSSRVQWAGMC